MLKNLQVPNWTWISSQSSQVIKMFIYHLKDEQNYNYPQKKYKKKTNKFKKKITQDSFNEKNYIITKTLYIVTIYIHTV